VESRYNRAHTIARTRRMMQAWADYLVRKYKAGLPVGASPPATVAKTQPVVTGPVVWR